MRIYRTGAIIACASLFGCALLSLVYAQAVADTVDVDISIESLPMQLGAWAGRQSEGLSIRSQEILRLTRYVRRDYVKDQRPVSLYIGYWKEQTGEYQAAKHSPALCLPSNGWDAEHKPNLKFPLDGELTTIKRIVGSYKGTPHLFYYWFFSGENTYAEEWFALLNISFQKLFHGRSDGGIVELSVPLLAGLGKVGSEAEGDQVLQDFINAFSPELQRLVHNPTVTPAVPSVGPAGSKG